MRNEPVPGSPAVRHVLAILEDLRIEWPVPAAETVIRRTYCGRWQLAKGKFSWYLEASDESRYCGWQYPRIGSGSPVRALRRGRVSWFRWHRAAVRTIELIQTRGG